MRKKNAICFIKFRVLRFHEPNVILYFRGAPLNTVFKSLREKIAFYCLYKRALNPLTVVWSFNPSLCHKGHWLNAAPLRIVAQTDFSKAGRG